MSAYSAHLGRPIQSSSIIVIAGTGSVAFGIDEREIPTEQAGMAIKKATMAVRTILVVGDASHGPCL